MTHTSGPWRADHIEHTIYDSGRNKEIALAIGTSRANECLIAAAPDLLAALKELDTIIAGQWSRRYGAPDLIEQEARQRARAAIAKAEGK